MDTPVVHAVLLNRMAVGRTAYEAVGDGSRSLGSARDGRGRMSTMDSKENVLRLAGFRYNFDRMSYVNRASKKVFSVEAVEDHSEDWLVERIREANDSGEWQFYFNEPPSAAVVRGFLAAIDERRAAS
jgi:hypothetical protein